MMLNPAWRPARACNGTLDRIQHHYMDVNAKDSSRALPMQVPVIKAAVTAAAAAEIDYLIEALHRQLQLPVGDTASACEWQVRAAEPSDLTRMSQLPMLLIVAEAQLSAIRQAYMQLKYLTQNKRAPCGAMIQGARDVHAARRYYRRLAMASMRFLDLPLLNFGSVPPRNQDYSSALARLAEKIRESAFVHAAQSDQGDLV